MNIFDKLMPMDLINIDEGQARAAFDHVLNKVLEQLADPATPVGDHKIKLQFTISPDPNNRAVLDYDWVIEVKSPKHGSMTKKALIRREGKKIVAYSSESEPGLFDDEMVDLARTSIGLKPFGSLKAAK